jgi:hypothetical protein
MDEFDDDYFDMGDEYASGAETRQISEYPGQYVIGLLNGPSMALCARGRGAYHFWL